MTTSSAVRPSKPSAKTAALRNDAARASAELANTVEALASRLDVRAIAREQTRAAWKATAPILGACVAGAVAIVAVVRLIRRDGASPNALRGGEIAAGAGALTAGAATYALVNRFAGPSAPAGRGGRSGGSKARRSTGGQSDVGRLNGHATAAAMRMGGRPNVGGRANMAGGGGARAGAVAGATVEGHDDLAGGDVVDLLMEQHRQADIFFNRVRTAKGSDKREAFSTLVEVLRQHEQAEQQTIHTVLRDLGADAAEVVASRMNEEEAADRTLTALIGRGVDDPRFDRGLNQLQEMVHAHAAHEEAEEFPMLRRLVSDFQLRRMASEVRFGQRDHW